jgi:hypothetical protein
VSTSTRKEPSVLHVGRRSHGYPPREMNEGISMSEAYNTSVRLYWMAKNTDASNRQFNVESKKLDVHDDYLTCLRILVTYSRTHQDPVVAYAVWGGRKRLGLRFQGKNVTVGVVKGGDIERGATREVKNPFELRKYLENTMAFTVANLNEEMFEKAYEQLKNIESEKKIIIDPQETKKWQSL